MRLIPIPDASGNTDLWVSADHLVSVQKLARVSAGGIALDVELKVDGMPLQRIRLGEFALPDLADEAFKGVLQRLRVG